MLLFISAQCFSVYYTFATKYWKALAKWEHLYDISKFYIFNFEFDHAWFSWWIAWKKTIVAKIVVRHDMLPWNYSQVSILSALVKIRKIRLLKIAACNRSSRPEVSYKKKILLKSSQYSPEYHLCWSFPFNKFAGLRLRYRSHSVNFERFLKTFFY